ncbi:MAG: 50S ribosomal protein L9 [Proteobacteria bacterium]|nr:50S ribosomal protein L9 [Pseudomonadota bacterium]
MDVILLERIEKLGQMGDVVTVKPGYARNYLLPRGKALRATDGNRQQFETQRVQLEAENLKRREEAEAVAKKMTGMTVMLIRQAGEAGQLYGSVSARDIAEAVTKAGVSIKRAQVVLDNPIKSIGLHDIRIELHGEVIVTVRANVARSPEEADVQLQTGGAVLSLAQQEEAEAQAAQNALVEQANTMFDEEAAAIPQEEPEAEKAE